MKSKLRKAVEQTVRWYENCADDDFNGDCGFCEQYKNGCDNCPIFLLDGGCIANDKLYIVRMDAWEGDVPSCLAIMVYVWGFINFGEDFKKE